MKLKTIIFYNRAPFDRLELCFEDDNIAVLSGINGTGKTTILSHIVDAIYELAKSAYTFEFEKIKTKFYRISSSVYSLDSSKASLVYMRFAKEDGDTSDYIDIRDACNQDEYDSIIALPQKIPYSSISKHCKKGSVYKYWSLTDDSEIEKIFSSSLLTYFPAYRYEMPSYLNDPYQIKLSFKTESDFSGYLSNPIEVMSDLPQIANWIMDLVLDRTLYRGQAATVFNQLNSVITSILFSKLQKPVQLGLGPRYSGASRIAVMDPVNKQQVYPSIFCMSSGELALLCLFGELIKQSDRVGKTIQQVSGIVLVDEIDKHLHIRLQKEILPILIALFPNVQFIVTSHSPFFGLGLAEIKPVKYKIYDLDNHGLTCLPQNNDLFREVYTMMIKENKGFYSRYKALQASVKNSSRPLIITEGKTDWKHLKAAQATLDITDLDIEYYEYEDTLGDLTLLQLLKDYSRFKQQRIIIGVFDRDNFTALKCPELESQEYVDFQNNVYGFSIPPVNTDLYGSNISIEHYYKKADLTKEDENGRRLFLGDEFYSSGISKNGVFHTRCKGIDKKVQSNGIVDEKVYNVSLDPEEKNSLALSKNDFAELILSKDQFAEGFEFSEFTKIFDIIRKIVDLDISKLD